MPTIYEANAIGDQAVAHLHYFKPGHDWYITARDTTKKQMLAYGRVNFGAEAGITYISIQSLLENGVELDMHWTPRKLAEI